jgi:hypothetical protein
MAAQAMGEAATRGCWARTSGQGQGEFLPPREDLNCPDLYIPGVFFIRGFNPILCSGPCFFISRTVMSIVTYILLAALHAGYKFAV